jgi:uncharacterized membrane protein YeaQ/YmgE (transglycosylase-associated protein family)
VSFDGNDYTIVGLALELVGGYLLARGFLRSVSFETTRMHLDSNPFQIRSLVRSHWEARVGFICFFLGVLGALVGTVRSAQVGQASLARDSLYPFLVSVVVGAVVLACGLTMLVDRVARRRYVPILRRHQEEAFHAVQRILTDGEADERQKKEARKTLDQVATLLDEPRTDGETDSAVIDRLRRHYPSP